MVLVVNRYLYSDNTIKLYNNNGSTIMVAGIVIGIVFIGYIAYSIVYDSELLDDNDPRF